MICPHCHKNTDAHAQTNGHYKVESLEILAFLNKKSGNHFRAVESNLALIRNRLKDGATVDQIRAVVGIKATKWKSDPKMAEFLRPATLFNRTKFEQYLGELPATAFEDDDGDLPNV